LNLSVYIKQLVCLLLLRKIIFVIEQSMLDEYQRISRTRAE